MNEHLRAAGFSAGVKRTESGMVGNLSFTLAGLEQIHRSIALAEHMQGASMAAGGNGCLQMIDAKHLKTNDNFPAH